ncbi:MAG: DUF1700 domain-containing protein [Clostridiales bacterium]|nr:DUF1700 domain-containing protein [Clostridiales bacterium]
MEKILNDYLENIEKYLKPLPVSERVDIVKEIKSEILELQNSGKTAEEIIERLGDAKELAKAYLGDLIANSNSFSRNRILALCAYYSLASISGLIVIPTLAICAPVFILCAIITPILGTVKLVEVLFNMGIPYADHITVIGVENPYAVFILCIIIGVILYLIGLGCWKLLIYYIKGVGKAKQHLSV